MYRSKYPLCKICEANGVTKASEHVDHVDHKKYGFYDEEGWQALCAECHNKKSGKDGSKIKPKA